MPMEGSTSVSVAKTTAASNGGEAEPGEIQ